MTMKTLVCTLFCAFVAASAFSGTAQADTTSAYERAREKNRGHVGIHQRREALREHLAGGGNIATPVADIMPAAGTENTPEKAEQPQAQPAAPGKTTGQQQ